MADAFWGPRGRPRPCSCGSGLDSEWHHDARGIELFRGCEKCAPEKLKRYRPEVLNNPRYEADEPIDGDEDWI
jgi:hypothetical protein